MSAKMKNPTMKTLMKVTVSMKTTMTTVQHRLLRIVWYVFSFSTVQRVNIQGVFWSLWGRCLLLHRVVRPCTGLCGKPVRQKKRRTSIFSFAVLSNSSTSDCVHPCSRMRIWYFSSSRRRTTVPYFPLRNKSDLLLSGLFVMLESVHNVDSLEHSSKRNCELQGT